MNEVPQEPKPADPAIEAARAKVASANDTTSKQPFDFRHLTPTQKRKVIFATTGGAIGLLIIILVVGALAYINRANQAPIEASPTPIPSPSPSPTPSESASNLDGTIVANELATRHPLAIMVENHPDARPQTGLSQASIVYEAITEGGITRFMALYGPTLPPKVGPVRSAREVFVDFAEEFTPNSAYYAHVGGAANALSKISGDKIYDLNQSSIGTKAFERFPRKGIASEHTMYTYPDKLYQVAKDLGYQTTATFRSWKFKDDAPVETRPDSQTITIPFSSASYEVKYNYDKLTNTYKRQLAGSDHKDAGNNEQLKPRNVVVEFASYATVKSAGKDVQHVGVIGNGTAKVFRDGKVIEAKWEKPSSPGRTIYTDAATGQEIEFNRGQTWVEVAKIGTSITVQ